MNKVNTLSPEAAARMQPLSCAPVVGSVPDHSDWTAKGVGHEQTPRPEPLHLSSTRYSTQVSLCGTDLAAMDVVNYSPSGANLAQTNHLLVALPCCCCCFFKGNVSLTLQTGFKLAETQARLLSSGLTGMRYPT